MGSTRVDTSNALGDRHRGAMTEGQLASERVQFAMWVATHESARELQSHGRRLNLEDAEFACALLKRRGMAIDPFDFPNTPGVWHASNEEGVPYTQVATEQFIDALGRYEKADPTKPEGFREILKWLNIYTFRNEVINEHGTTLSGMISRPWYGSSPSIPVLELIENSPRFRAIKEVGLAPWDFPEAPNSLWRDSNGRPTETARRATKVFLRCIAEDKEVSPRSREGFREILRDFDHHMMASYPINYWGTTLAGMLSHAYRGSGAWAVIDLVQNDSEFRHIAAVGLAPYDFPKAPQNTWIDKQRKTTIWARHATAALLSVIAEREGVNVLTRAGFEAAAALADRQAFRTVPINFWGTRLTDMLRVAYAGEPEHAIKDLAQHDTRFALFIQS